MRHLLDLRHVNGEYYKMRSSAAAIRAATDLVASPHREIAKEVGVTPLTLSHWRTGRRNPTPRNLMELGRVLLDHSRAVERAAVELMRLAEQEERRHGHVEPAVDRSTLELFRGGVEAND